MKLLFSSIILSICFPLSTFSINDKLLFIENKNQWVEQVKYKVGVGNGTTLFMEKDKFTFVKYNPDELEKIHENSHLGRNKGSFKEGLIHFQAFQMSFIGSNKDVEITSSGKEAGYYNYFIGNNPAKWASEVGLYKEVKYENIYNNISLHAYEQNQNFKYDFIVGAGADASLIQMKFDGADKVRIKNNRLIIETSVGEIIENSPYTYQIIDDVKKEVKCEYKLSSDGSTVSFSFPDGYDDSYELIIDPVLVGASYSGGGANNAVTYGHCATYDLSGNIYTGGECFDPGYPTTMGSFQAAFGGGMVDIAISKLSPTATTLIWATYVGGSDDEIPNSLFVNNGEIYILGATQSSDYPTSAGCFDNSYNGAADICITHLNATGTALVGSTFMGGTGEDGGTSTWTSLPWAINGHDQMRGEIIVDASGNAYVASFTNSANFPTTAGAYKQVINGANTYDAVLFKMNPTLSSRAWSTYVGGTSDECAYGLRVSNSGDVYFTGATTSNDFPVTTGVYDASYNGGASDAYTARLSANGSTLVASTFIGTNSDEIGYFLDLDVSGNPCIYGISQGNMPVTAGVYSNAGGANFVSCFNTGLTGLTYSTVFGTVGSYLEPEAFMVDVCGNLYMSGFGAGAGFPTTSNALFTSSPTGFDNCYFIVLSKNAATLLYGSFYYGNHVDGGTSRFDPSGTIYQGICIGSGGAVATPGAYADASTAPSWDMFVVKIAFQYAGVTAIASAALNDTVCLGTPINFLNNSTGAVNYTWNFGDGSAINTTTSPSYIYTNPGSYTITLIAYDSTGCVFSDTTTLKVVVLPGPKVNLGNDSTMCVTPNMVLNAQNPGCTYLWSTGANSQTITVTSFGTYWVKVDNGVCAAYDTIKISQITVAAIFGNDTTLCVGQNVNLIAPAGAASYLWSTGATTPSINVTTSGTYWVTAVSGLCVLKDTINVNFVPYPVVNLGPDLVKCPGDQVMLNGGGPATTYLWSTGETTQTITITTPDIYSVVVSNHNCVKKDTVKIDYVEPIGWTAPPNFCNVFTYTLDAGSGANSYSWSTGETTQSIQASKEGLYWVTVQKQGCIIQDTMYIDQSLGGATMFLPNTFTPDHDGLNDKFMVKGTNLTYFQMLIFNRWGELIFKSNDQYQGWDGYYKGELAKQDVYVCKIKYKTLCSKDELLEKIAHVTVLR